MRPINRIKLVNIDGRLPLERPGGEALKIYLARFVLYLVVVALNFVLLGLILLVASLPVVLVLLFLVTGLVVGYVYFRLRVYLVERPFPVLEAVAGSALGLGAAIAFAIFVPSSSLHAYLPSSERVRQASASQPATPTLPPATRAVVVLVTEVKAPLPTDTPTLLPDTPTPSATSTPTTTPTPELPTPTATLTPTQAVATNTPVPTPAVPAGAFTLLTPRGDDTISGPTTFEWTWSGALAPEFGFEVRVWREGGIPAGVHDAVLDNREGRIQRVSENTYRLTVDIADAPGVQRLGGQYLWTVLLVRIGPAYQELGPRAEPATFKFESPGGASPGG